jgi:hypothetical protein
MIVNNKIPTTSNTISISKTLSLPCSSINSVNSVHASISDEVLQSLKQNRSVVVISPLKMPNGIKVKTEPVVRLKLSIPTTSVKIEAETTKIKETISKNGIKLEKIPKIVNKDHSNLQPKVILKNDVAIPKQISSSYLSNHKQNEKVCFKVKNEPAEQLKSSIPKTNPIKNVKNEPETTKIKETTTEAKTEPRELNASNLKQKPNSSNHNANETNFIKIKTESIDIEMTKNTNPSSSGLKCIKHRSKSKERSPSDDRHQESNNRSRSQSRNHKKRSRSKSIDRSNIKKEKQTHEKPQNENLTVSNDLDNNNKKSSRSENGHLLAIKNIKQEIKIEQTFESNTFDKNNMDCEVVEAAISDNNVSFIFIMKIK